MSPANSNKATWIYRALIGAMLTVGVNYAFKSYNILTEMYYKGNELMRQVDKHETRIHTIEHDLSQVKTDVSFIQGKSN
jgi:hypothetical protein